MPPDLTVKLEALLHEDENVHLRADADIGADGRFGVRWLVATDQRLLLLSSDEKDHAFPLSEVSGVWTERWVGSGAMLAQVDGRTVELVRYTHSLSRKFGEVAGLLQKRVKEGRWPEEVHAGGEDGYCSQAHPDGPASVSRKRVLRRIVRYARPYWWGALLAVVLTLITTGLGLVPPYLTRILVDRVFTPGGSVRLLSLIVGALVGMRILNLLISIAKSRLTSWLGGRITLDIRKQVYAHLQRLSFSFYDRTQVGALMSRITQDSSSLQGFLVNGLPYVATNLLTLVGIFVMLLSMNARLTLIVLIPLPFVVAGGLFFFRKIQPLQRRIWQNWAALNALLNNAISGIRVVKAFAQEDREAVRFDERNTRLFRANLRVQWITSAFLPGMGFVTGLGGVIVWWLGGREVIGGHVTLGTLIAFTAYLGMLYGPIQFLNQLNSMLSGTLVGAGRIFEILDHPPELYDDPDALPMPAVRGKITFHHVTFGYDGGPPVLRDVTFEVAPGETIGLVGATGAGKTTLVHLIGRFYEPDEGSILLGGVDLRKLKLSDLRSRIGMVPQEPFLFHGTIAENIAYARPQATREEIIQAARTANAHSFIVRLPDGYDAQVGERGVRLSGGERQRISIARAVLHHPAILILDEATSSVDSRTEHEIQQGMFRLMRNRTTFIIAHRLSSLQHADRLVVLDGGRKVEEGTHQELIAGRGAYYRLVQMQGGDGRAEGGMPAVSSDPVERCGWLDPERTSLGRDGDLGGITLFVRDGVRCDRVGMYRAFPLSDPDRYIGFLDDQGRDLGMVVDLDGLDGSSRKVLEEELEKRYFLPRILRIRRVWEERGRTHWEVNTDRGRRRLGLQDRREGLMDLGSGRWLVVDADGNRFEIPEMERLDRRSRTLLGSVDSGLS